MDRAMNTRTLVVLGVALLGCGPPVVTSPLEEPRLPSEELVLPAELASHLDLPAYLRFDGGVADDVGDRTFALGAGFPSQVTLTPTGPVYFVTAGCSYSKLPKASWSRLSQVTGTAATLALDGGTLEVALQSEGVVTALLEGEVTGADCKVGGVTVETMPLRHRLTLRVHRVGSLVVGHNSLLAASCGPTLVLPAGVELLYPTLDPVDPAGKKFQAANAQRPAALRMRSLGGGLLATDPYWLARLPAGRVELTVDTTLPVTGLQALEIVGPASIRTVDASLQISLATPKSWRTEPLENGKSYQVEYPDGRSTVDVAVTSVITDIGPLCSRLPGPWFLATTSTPGQCGPAVAHSRSDWRSAVAEIVRQGDCRLDVSVPGTELRWAAAFHVTY